MLTYGIVSPSDERGAAAVGERTERVIAAHDAHRDHRTICFRDGYLVPNGIGAMLDVPLRQQHGTLGVLCTEHVGGPRTWTLDEQNFAVSVGSRVG